MNKFVVLMGIPGSGKTQVGERFVQEQNFKFIQIDSFYKSVSRVNPNVEWFLDKEYTTNVYSEFEKEIMQSLNSNNVVIESTGVGPRIKEIISNIQKSNVTVTKIFLEVDFDEAHKRVSERNKTDYEIKVSEDDMNHFISKISEIDKTDVISIDANKSIDVVFTDISNKLFNNENELKQS